MLVADHSVAVEEVRDVVRVRSIVRPSTSYMPSAPGVTGLPSTKACTSLRRAGWPSTTNCSCGESAGNTAPPRGPRIPVGLEATVYSRAVVEEPAFAATA